jgi:hypothetical protein
MMHAYARAKRLLAGPAEYVTNVPGDQSNDVAGRARGLLSWQLDLLDLEL